jgi:hypothetical protein
MLTLHGPNNRSTSRPAPPITILVIHKTSTYPGQDAPSQVPTSQCSSETLKVRPQATFALVEVVDGLARENAWGDVYLMRTDGRHWTAAMAWEWHDYCFQLMDEYTDQVAV